MKPIRDATKWVESVIKPVVKDVVQQDLDLWMTDRARRIGWEYAHIRQLGINKWTHKDGKPESPIDNKTSTSREAAMKKRTSSADQREAVYNFILAYGPVTREEIADGMKISGDSVRPRVHELLGKRKTGPKLPQRIEELDNDWGLTKTGARATLLRVL